VKLDLNKRLLGGKTWQERKLTLEQPGRPLDYDCPREMVEEVSGSLNLGAAWEQGEGRSASQVLSVLGQETMARVMELADGKYLDRTGEMIAEVARRTGISFPHVLQRYLELFLLSTRLADGYAVSASTTSLLRLQIKDCVVGKTGRQAGGQNPCRCFCLSAFQKAAARAGGETGIKLAVDSSPDGSICQVSFSPLSPRQIGTAGRART
jgi:hypothetical protein